MNILSVSKNFVSNQSIHNLLTFKNDWKFIQLADIEDGFNQYKENNINFLLIDLDCEESKKFMNKIVDINPKQNILYFTDKLDCVDTNGCEFCTVNYNKKRIVKPFTEIDLLNVICLFEKNKCSHRNSVEDISLIMTFALKRFPDCKYNIEKKLISITANESYFALKTLLEVIDMLNTML